MKIIADAFGGDNAPDSVIVGACRAKSLYGVDIALVGKSDVIRKRAEEISQDITDMEIIEAEEIFDMHDDPKSIIKEKSNTSMAVGLKALADGCGDGFISAGSTGALVMGSTFIVKRIKGIKRTAFGSPIPSLDGGFSFLMDEGANVQCRPEMILQFAIMATAYVESVLGKKNPTVGLLNVGTEDTKGGELQLEAYQLLKNSDLNFIGNVESRDLLFGKCDILVTDGFSGNIALKTAEGAVSAILKLLKETLSSGLSAKIGALFLLPKLKQLKNKLDYKSIGAAPIIGAKKPVYKAHGNSDADAFCNAIGSLISSIEGDVIGKIEKALGDNK